MAQKKLKPGPLITAVTGSDWKSVAASDRINSETPYPVQAALAVSRLSRRFGLPVATAAAVAQANAWGCR